MQLRLPQPSCALAALSVLALCTAPPAQGYQILEYAGAEDERLGWSVASAGDLDGDTVPDVIVGGADLSRGVVHIYSGATSAVLRTYGGFSNEYFGDAVAGLGDVTGDGVPDYAISEPLGWNSGKVYAYCGATGSVHVTLFGGSGFGRALAALGDIDGDGASEFAVGVPYVNNNTGEVIVYSGATGTQLFVVTGLPSKQAFGGAVAGPGDVDGDGTPDLLVGAGGPGLFGGPGYAQVISGRTRLVLHTFNGAGRDRLGVSVSTMGDLDGDGFNEVIVGASLGAGLGYADVYSGNTGTLIWRVTGTGTGASGYFGWSVVGIGDVTADGVDDFAVGMPTAFTTATAGGRVYAFSGATGTEVARWEGVGGEWLGYSLASVGDLDFDGIPEFAAGAPYASIGGIDNSGVVQVLSMQGLPFGSFSFGSGCAGSGGFVPMLHTMGGAAASAGNPDFGLVMSRALGGANGLVIIGSSFQSWNGVPLPVDLSVIGLPGCSLNVSADVLLPVAFTGAGAGPGAGTAFQPFPIPNNPSLLATFVFFQGWVFDPGPGPIPAALSDGLKLLIF